MRARILIVLSVLLCSALTVAAAPAAPARTLVETKHPITSFAHDGGRIAWSVCPWNQRVSLRTLATGATRTFMADHGTCEGDSLVAPMRGIALAGNRLLWDLWLLSSSGESIHWGRLYTASLGDPSIAIVEVVQSVDKWSELGPMAGDAETLVYTVADCDFDLGCASEPVVGRLARVVGRQHVTVPGAPAAAVLAAAAGRVALARAMRIRSIPWQDFFSQPRFEAGRDGLVELRDATTGALIETFPLRGTVRGLALTRRAVAVMITDARGSRRVEVYELATGTRLRRTSVGPATANDLDMAGRRIVYRVGREIRLLNAETGRTRVLWRAPSRPVAVSIEGRRVAWAVNRWVDGRRRGTIESLILPRIRP